jgi:hypothetical protein
MRNVISALVALTLALAPASVLACAMEFEMPPMEDENDALLIALMEEIDLQLQEPEVNLIDLNEAKAAEADASVDAHVKIATPPAKS